MKKTKEERQIYTALRVRRHALEQELEFINSTLMSFDKDEREKPPLTEDGILFSRADLNRITFKWWQYPQEIYEKRIAKQ